MQFSLQVSPDGSDKRSVIRAHDRVQVTGVFPMFVAEKVRDALNKFDVQLDEWVPSPNPIGITVDPAGYKRASAKHDACHERLMGTLRVVLPEAFTVPR